MTPLRRRSPDPGTAAAREAFRRVTGELDAAQRVLLAAVPTSRDTGTPLAEAIDGFLAGLARAESSMSAWRTERTEAVWVRCERALAGARAAAGSLNTDSAAGSLGFEALNARLGDLLSPLEEFADVAAEIRRLR